ncbi:MAG: hypothetical protein P8N43_05935 [Alphaproteobacteria bacterium]|jgi:hypothetical protein|nr:hypothetical protein [Alphaproteobacteria bacterium]
MGSLVIFGLGLFQLPAEFNRVGRIFHAAIIAIPGCCHFLSDTVAFANAGAFIMWGEVPAFARTTFKEHDGSRRPVISNNDGELGHDPALLISVLVAGFRLHEIVGLARVARIGTPSGSWVNGREW